MESSPYLKRLYRFYNKKYFNGELPNIWLIFGQSREWKKARLSKTTCAATFFEAGRPIGIAIRYYKNKGRSYVKADLLHEMAHVARPRAGHGKVFQNEMKRLALAGAFEGIW